MKQKQKYEYKCITIIGFSEARDTTLNQYARDGWELQCVNLVWHYLRRPVSNLDPCSDDYCLL